ncbi:hypothetical protein, partial [Photobacterium kishitanii]|uniref:hypothetical protein n=1 Tax=Photobacterium kishitanii TaxID=318456 RepID=UPI0015E7DC96
VVTDSNGSTTIQVYNTETEQVSVQVEYITPKGKTVESTPKIVTFLDGYRIYAQGLLNRSNTNNLYRSVNLPRASEGVTINYVTFIGNSDGTKMNASEAETFCNNSGLHKVNDKGGVIKLTPNVAECIATVQQGYVIVEIKPLSVTNTVISMGFYDVFQPNPLVSKDYMDWQGNVGTLFNAIQSGLNGIFSLQNAPIAVVVDGNIGFNTLLYFEPNDSNQSLPSWCKNLECIRAKDF